MNRHRLLFLLFAFPTLGCFLSFLLLQLIPIGTFAVWRPLGSPPESPVSIINLTPESGRGANWVNVYVRTASGTVYHRLNGSTESWMSVQSPDVPAGPWSECSEVNWPDLPGQRPPYVNRIPGQVVSCAKIRYSWEVFVDDMIVVLLSDGSLWYYRYETDLFKVLAYPLSGIFLGILAAFLVSARQKQPPFVQDH